MGTVTEAYQQALSLPDLTVRDLHERYRAGEIRPSDVVAAHLERVLTLDLKTDGNPPVNCILSLADEVRREAEILDERLDAGQEPDGLFGTPVWIKDNINVRGLPTTCGCLALEDNVAEQDAPLVARLRQAGALVMGKVGMTELGKGTSAFSTMSCRIGNAYNPRNPPGGSSNGSAVAVAMGFGILSVGVDDMGSITNPAAFNGCVGLRPTVGLASREGILLHAAAETSPGPIARTVHDAAAMLHALRSDTADGTGAEWRPEALDSATLKGVRIGILRSVGGRSFAKTGPPVEPTEQLDRFLSALRDAGVEIISELHLDAFRLRRRTNTSYYNKLTAALRRRSDPPRSVYELFTGGRVAPHLQIDAQNWRIRLARPLLSWPLPNVQGPLHSLTIRHNRSLLAAKFAEHRLDCVIALTNALPAAVGTLAQVPHLTLPTGTAPARTDTTGFADVIPVGLSLLGAPGADDLLLCLGAAVERETNLTRAPMPDPGNTAPGLRVDAFRRIKKRTAHGSLDLLGPGPSGHQRPTADEFRDFVDGLLTQETSLRTTGVASPYRSGEALKSRKSGGDV
jgi:Asp-tRNA(Asn)/Glu-tRNA(Gln) amidotransferase A subunit family amidase